MVPLDTIRTSVSRWSVRLGGIPANRYACPRCGDRDGFDVEEDDVEAMSSLAEVSARILHCRSCGLTIIIQGTELGSGRPGSRSGTLPSRRR